MCFTPLQTYKVLKLRKHTITNFRVLHLYKLTRFSNWLTILNACLLVLHLYKLTRFSNALCVKLFHALVLHLYKLTRFSNCWSDSWWYFGFYTFTNLQGSQTHIWYMSKNAMFYTFTNLQGSQTVWGLNHPTHMFYTFTNLQGSQTNTNSTEGRRGFTPLQTYKVLKQLHCSDCISKGFTPLQTYKVLKPPSMLKLPCFVLHLYKLTRFSNWRYRRTAN